MTPQIRLALLGGTASLVTKFYFQKSWATALTVGLATISVFALLTAKPDKE